MKLEVRNAALIKPVPEHSGTANVWYLFTKKDKGSWGSVKFTEFAVEFEVPGGGVLEPHRHNTEEWYYILSGRAVMTIEDESKDVYPGDLIFIPPNALHTIKPKGQHYPLRGFCFSVPAK